MVWDVPKNIVFQLNKAAIFQALVLCIHAFFVKPKGYNKHDCEAKVASGEGL